MDPVNIRDIAEAADVSITTVSHALRGRGRVAPATRERVLRIAKELGYTANVHAQRLVAGRSRTLAIQIAGFATATSLSHLLPDATYFIDLLNGAAAMAGDHDYAVLLAPYLVDAAARLHPLTIDGGVIVDPAEGEAMATTLFERGIPVVTTGRAPPGATILPWVDNDHAAITRRMLDHLAAHDYGHPALVATTPTRSYVADIVNAYLGWTRERDIPPTVVTLAEPPTERAAARAANRLLSKADRPDAVYATYDRLALGVLVQAQRLGISVPEQLGVASAVDSDAMRWASPHITAAFLDARRVGGEAVRLLIDLIEGREPQSRTVTIPARIIPRSSTLRGVGERGSRRRASTHAGS